MEQEDADLALALQLQACFTEDTLQKIDNHSTTKSEYAGNKKRIGSSVSSIIDDCWEIIDPNPNIHDLFLQFNATYFGGKLEGVEVRWSPRMTLCAGLCCYEGYGGLCSVRLSQPLLKFRPRKDLVQTLLHEMIHAYLFVTHNNKDHDSHGPEFLKHMYRINKESGAHITVYHTFHDEVNEHRKHWWRCNGPCRKHPPFYGYVKRAMNRAPSSLDPWWSRHKSKCDGVFIKIKEPESKKNTEKQNCKDLSGMKKNMNSKLKDIREYVKVKPASKDKLNKPVESQHYEKSPMKESRLFTSQNGFKPQCSASSNVHTLTDDKRENVNVCHTFIPFSGRGYVLNSSTETPQAKIIPVTTRVKQLTGRSANVSQASTKNTSTFFSRNNAMNGGSTSKIVKGNFATTSKNWGSRTIVQYKKSTDRKSENIKQMLKGNFKQRLPNKINEVKGIKPSATLSKSAVLKTPSLSAYTENVSVNKKPESMMKFLIRNSDSDISKDTHKFNCSKNEDNGSLCGLKRKSIVSDNSHVKKKLKEIFICDREEKEMSVSQHSSTSKAMDETRNKLHETSKSCTSTSGLISSDMLPTETNDICVECPVCGVKVLEAIINSHLDECLS